MTAQETRDALAEMDGWKWTPMGTRSQIIHPDPTATYTYTASVPCGPYRWLRYGVVREDHPHPPTLDGADAAVPEGYEWERTPFEWWAWKHGSRMDGPAAKVDDTGDKIADLYALALACRKAMDPQRITKGPDQMTAQATRARAAVEGGSK